MYTIELSKKALLHNVQTFRSQIGEGTEIMAIVKSNAYGHGMKEVSEIVKNKVDLFGVVHIDEALKLRSFGITLPILVLGYTAKERIIEAIESNIMLSVFHFDILKEYAEILKNKKLSIHLKFDTGLHRMGWFSEDIPALHKILSSTSSFDVKGIFSHFADAENPASVQTEQQLKNFNKIISTFKELGYVFEYIHTGASAATLMFPSSHFNTIRIGIGMYGLWPSEETRKASEYSKQGVVLQPVLSYKTKVIQVKDINVGDLVGYGGTFRAYRNMRMAVIPVGYAEGLVRKLSKNGYFLVNGCKAPIIGHICMNMTMLDVTDCNDVKYGDTVTLIGTQGQEKVTADNWAKWVESINYEITTKLPREIERKVVN